MKAISIKKLSKKSLSVFLAVLMLMSSMSVCFSTVAFATGGTVSDYGPLATALNNDSVKNATWSKTNQYDYVVEDADGLVAAAVEAYFAQKKLEAEQKAAEEKAAAEAKAKAEREANPTTEDLLRLILAEIKKN